MWLWLSLSLSVYRMDARTKVIPWFMFEPRAQPANQATVAATIFAFFKILLCFFNVFYVLRKILCSRHVHNLQIKQQQLPKLFHSVFFLAFLGCLHFLFFKWSEHWHCGCSLFLRISQIFELFHLLIKLKDTKMIWFCRKFFKIALWPLDQW